jgi:NADH-quinone oxidoreductase subunit M
VISVVVTAFYVIRCIQRVYFGPVNERWAGLGDGSLREVLPLVILVIVLVTVGFYPRLILDLIQPEMRGLAAKLG